MTGEPWCFLTGDPRRAPAPRQLARPTLTPVEILLWLVPTVLMTGAAMLVAGWAGRERSTSDRKSEQAKERFAVAIQKKLPESSVARPRPARDRSTGIAVRKPHPARRRTDDTRRSA